MATVKELEERFDKQRDLTNARLNKVKRDTKDNRDLIEAVGDRLAETHDRAVDNTVRLDQLEPSVANMINEVQEARKDSRRAISTAVAVADEIPEIVHDVEQAHARLDGTEIEGEIDSSSVFNWGMAIFAGLATFFVAWLLPLNYSGYESWHVGVFGLIAFATTMAVSAQTGSTFTGHLIRPERTAYQRSEQDAVAQDDSASADDTREMDRARQGEEVNA